MAQPINKKNRKIGNHHQQTVKEKSHPKFGTSKLEKTFEEEFLKKMKIKYIWQYEAKEIGRWFDFYIPDSNILIEVDGDYW